MQHVQVFLKRNFPRSSVPSMGENFSRKGKGRRLLAPCNQSPGGEAYQPPPAPASANPSCNAINHHDKFNYPAVCDKARRASSLLSNFTYLASPLSFRPPLPLRPLSSVFFAENPRERERERELLLSSNRETFRKLEVESFRFVSAI